MNIHDCFPVGGNAPPHIGPVVKAGAPWWRLVSCALLPPVRANTKSEARAAFKRMLSVRTRLPILMTVERTK